MRRSGILNPDLAWAINRLGHTHTFAIGDCGLPLPAGVKVIDLSLVFGVPSFADVARAILNEVVVDSATIATATPDEVRRALAESLPTDDRAADECATDDRATGTLPLVEVDHEELKAQLAGCSFIVRTGETTPYANAIFHCGVAF